MLLFTLEFTREYEHRQDTELYIGIYESREEAEAVIASLRDKPGFSEYPEGFAIHETHVGLTGWKEGFVTTHGKAPKGAASEAFDLPAWMFDKQ